MVIPGDFDWDDVGDFASIAKLHAGGRKSDLAILGEGARVLADSSTGVVISQGKRLISLIGVTDIVVVDTDDGRWRYRWAATSSGDAKERVVADRQHQPSRKACRQPAAQCKTKMMNETVEATGALRPWRQDAVGEAFSKDTLPKSYGFAAKATDGGYQLHRSSRQRQIIDLAAVVAVHATAGHPAARAAAGR